MYLNLYLLDIFVTVVEEGSFKKAGEKFRLTPSAVSSYMQRLEKSIEKPLFKQTKGEILLTKDGMIIMEYALKMREMQKQLHSVIHSEEETRELVKVGGGLISGCYLLPKVLSAYHQIDNDINYSLQVSDSLEIIEAISEHKMDLGIVLGDNLPPDLQYHTIFKDRYILVATPSFLEHLPDPVRYKDLEDIPFVLPLLHVPRAVRQQLEHIDIKKQRLNMGSSNIEVSNPVAAKEVVKTGYYMGYLLQSTIQEELNQGILQEIKVDESELPAETAEYVIIWKGALSEKARQLLNFILGFDF